MADLRHIGERTGSKPVAGEILALLGTEGKKILRNDIAKLLDISERSTRANIAWLNEQGYPIISSGAGFFYAQSAKDFDDAITRLEAEEDNIRKRKQNLEKMKMEFQTREAGGGQLSLLEL